MPAKKTEEEKNAYKEPPKSRYHSIELYPDDPRHRWILDHLKRYPNIYKIAWILHDKDVWTEEDEKEDSACKAGDFKKAHYHVLVYKKSAQSAEGFAKYFALNYCENVDDPAMMLLYFLHDDPSSRDKHPYLVDELHGHSDFIKLVQYKNLHFVQLCELLHMTEKLSMVQLTEFVRDNPDYTDVFNKYQAWIRGQYVDLLSRKNGVEKQLSQINNNMMSLTTGVWENLREIQLNIMAQ